MLTQAYRRLLNYAIEFGGVPEDAIIDLRGNHDVTLPLTAFQISLTASQRATLHIRDAATLQRLYRTSLCSAAQSVMGHVL